MQMRGVGGPANPYIRVGEPVALQPGGQCRPPRCRATGPQGPARNFLHEFFFKNAPAALLPGGQVPATQQPGGRVYSCKFRKQKYIFVKTKTKNKKIKKRRQKRVGVAGGLGVGFLAHTDDDTQSFGALPQLGSWPRQRPIYNARWAGIAAYNGCGDWPHPFCFFSCQSRASILFFVLKEVTP